EENDNSKEQAYQPAEHTKSNRRGKCRLLVDHNMNAYPAPQNIGNHFCRCIQEHGFRPASRVAQTWAVCMSAHYTELTLFGLIRRNGSGGRFNSRLQPPLIQSSPHFSSSFYFWVVRLTFHRKYKSSLLMFFSASLRDISKTSLSKFREAESLGHR